MAIEFDPQYGKLMCSVETEPLLRKGQKVRLFWPDKTETVHLGYDLMPGHELVVKEGGKNHFFTSGAEGDFHWVRSVVSVEGSEAAKRPGPQPTSPHSDPPPTDSFSREEVEDKIRQMFGEELPLIQAVRREGEDRNCRRGVHLWELEGDRCVVCGVSKAATLQARPLLVIIESPLRAETEEGRERNKRYARAAMRDALLHHLEFPFASHLLYDQPGLLHDEVPEERELGIRAGLAWGRFATRTVVYADLGISEGMAEGLRAASEAGREIIFRYLGEGWDDEAKGRAEDRPLPPHCCGQTGFGLDPEDRCPACEIERAKRGESDPRE